MSKILKKYKSGRDRKPISSKSAEKRYFEEDLIKEKFAQCALNHLWCSDITELTYYKGRLELEMSINVQSKNPQNLRFDYNELDLRSGA